MEPLELAEELKEVLSTEDEMLEVPSRVDESSEASLSVQVLALRLDASSAQGLETKLAYE